MQCRSRHQTTSLLAVILLVLGLTSVPVAAAQGADPGDGGAADAEVAIIMDASSSMLEPDEGGTRLDVAKQAAGELVDELPETARVGMLAYGTQVSDAPENHAEGCEDIRTLAPVGPVDKDQLRDEIDGLEARGYTPIGNSLRAAADELSPDASERSIVLVSDGIDTCAPPPVCEVAEELADEGVGLAVHVVGFRADEATRAELECVAGATGGSYRQADDAAALTESLKFLTQRAIRDYETFGTEFEFADTPDDALYVGEGLYRTTVRAEPGLGVAEAPEQYLRVAVPEGHMARVAVTAIPDVDLGSQGGGQRVSTRLSAENPSDSSCRDTRDLAATTGGGFEPPESAVIDLRARGGSQGDPECDGAAWVLTGQFRTDRDGVDQDLDLEMTVQFEPLDVDQSAHFVEGDTGGGDEPPPVPLDDPQEAAGGNSFSGATEISEGAFTDSIVPGEFRYYSFPVEWGQRPVVTYRVGPSTREVADMMYLDMYGPVRHGVGGNWTPFYDTVEESTIAVDRPILYRNREANRGGQARALAGEHYLAVSLNVNDRGDYGVEQPFEFAIRMDGQTVDGPEWVPVNEPGPEPSVEPLLGEDAEPSVDPAPGDDDEVEQVAADEDGSMSTTVWLVLGGALVLLALVGGGLWILLRGPRAERL